MQIEYLKSKKETPRKATRTRQACILVETEITVHATLDGKAWKNRVQNLGWRVYACNDKALSLSEAVLAYRQEYLIEHGFARYKGKMLGLTPIYLSSTHRIKGLIRLLSIGLRVLCLLEFTVREALLKKEEKLSGIYKGNPKRATARPTAEMMLGTFRGISLMVMSLHDSRYVTLTPLTAVQVRILTLLGLAASVYTNLADIP
ncbi:IS1634 family transposase [Legionella sp. CNM-4043-24]|uniref:IS1634 family transposase n=1 Tax=Legionella sp. CNM-4043-24 TaxID=3421646 RepID=UPI00403A9EDD